MHFLISLFIPEELTVIIRHSAKSVALGDGRLKKEKEPATLLSQDSLVTRNSLRSIQTVKSFIGVAQTSIMLVPSSRYNVIFFIKLLWMQLNVIV